MKILAQIKQEKLDPFHHLYFFPHLRLLLFNYFYGLVFRAQFDKY